ncbi:MAG: ATP-binding domain-containing protein, partial [Ktedonobacteraceae bacterium]|nr:ATP-binding domain-containing protein [Ktedonobacteraceae bacterium]
HNLCNQCNQQLENDGLPVMRQGKSGFDLFSESIKVMTIHSAKGLEFPVVFLVMPSIAKNEQDEEAQLELFEKGRTLCYVGMTRASDALYLLNVQSEESVFVNELAEKVIPW